MRFEEAVEKFQPLSPYERGLVAGIYRFAWMKDGAYYVGTTGSLLGDGIARAISEHRESQVESYDFTAEPDTRPGMDGWFDIWCRFGGSSSCVARVFGEKRAEVVRDALSEEANEVVG